MFKTLLVAAVLIATPVMAEDQPATPETPSPLKNTTLQVPAVCGSAEDVTEFLQGTNYDVLLKGKAKSAGLSVVAISPTEPKALVTVQTGPKTLCLLLGLSEVQYNKGLIFELSKQLISKHNEE